MWAVLIGARAVASLSATLSQTAEHFIGSCQPTAFPPRSAAAFDDHPRLLSAKNGGLIAVAIHAGDHVRLVDVEGMQRCEWLPTAQG